MNEFEEKDYGEARSLADNILGNANNILDIFNGIDQVMKQLYGENWQSEGANAASDRYSQIRKNYEVFYEKVVAMKNHIYCITAANEAADAAASSLLTKI